MAVTLNGRPLTTAYVQRYRNWFTTTTDPETLTVTADNVAGIIPAQLLQMADAAAWPAEEFREVWDTGAYTMGSTEPWIAEVLASLLKACDAKRVVECGGFMGMTSGWLALTLQQMGGGDLTIIELEADRASACLERMGRLDPKGVSWRVLHDDVFRAIEAFEDEWFDFAWVDDNHEKDHVDRELAALIPKMRTNGIICGHDVYGTCDLQEIFRKHGGYALDFPRLGPAGGIGILQVR